MNRKLVKKEIEEAKNKKEKTFYDNIVEIMNDQTNDLITLVLE